MGSIDFWHDFASTYSYPAAARIEEVAARAGVRVRWRPFLLGPIFKSNGWPDSPFKLQPDKGRYMWRDLERICGALTLPFQRPHPFPQRSITAARVALIGHVEGWGVAFSVGVYQAQFAEGRDIGERAVLTEVLAALRLDPDAVIGRAEAPENKLRLRQETETAQTLGLFGAPSFVTEAGELFWGNDRLEEALAWAQAEAA